MIMTATMCLALNIFFEARAEPIDGQIMVAEVTLNRVASEHFPDTVCDVVWQRKQFSWTHDGKHDDPTRMSYLDKQSWKEIKQLAKEILDDPENTLLGTRATHYHADYVEPYWTSSLMLVGKSGKHIFYTYN